MATWTERIPDVVPLTSVERGCLAELEATIETGLNAFLATGRALSEIRSRRLYREHFSTFETYVAQRWSCHRARIDEVIQLTRVADLLLETTGSAEGPTPLRNDTPQAALRALSWLPTEELQQTTWQLLARASPNGRRAS